MKNSHKLLAVASAAFMLSGASAIAGAVSTIWTDSASYSGVTLQEFDLSGNLLDTVNAPHGNNGRGIVQIGNILYYTSASTPGVFAYNFATNTDLGTVFSVAGSSGLATIAYDGSHLFLGDYSGSNNVYEYTLTGSLVATIPLSKCSSYCDGLEYANGHLISNEYDGGEGGSNTYDVYSTTGTLLDAGFIHGQDPSGNTGIAYDGTDYYVSNIFSGTLGVYDGSGTYLHDITLKGSVGDVEDISVNYTQVLSAAPEPSTWALMMTGIGLLGLYLRNGKGLRRRDTRTATA